MAILIFLLVCIVAFIALLKKMKKAATKHNLPKWFVYLNFCSLLPILVWPAVAFGSVFLFDHPTNMLETIATVILILSYPLFIFGSFFLSFKLYHKIRLLSIALPFIPILAFIYFIIYVSSL